MFKYLIHVVLLNAGALIADAGTASGAVVDISVCQPDFFCRMTGLGSAAHEFIAEQIRVCSLSGAC
jgi:hypothetical protein